MLSPGEVFDRIVHRQRGAGRRVALDEAAGDDGAQGEHWEAIALPRSAVAPDRLRRGDLVVQRALGEGKLACLRVVGEDVQTRTLYAADGLIRADTLVLRRMVAEEGDKSFLRWSPGTRAERFPPRGKDARKGKAFFESDAVKGIGPPADWNTREDAMVAELLAGNMPGVLLRWVEIELSVSTGGRTIEGAVKVLPDYLAIGDDDGYVYAPLDAVSAQKVADAFDCVLPTARICHAIYKQCDARHRLGALARDYYKKDSERTIAPRRWAQDSTSSYVEHSEAIRAKMADAKIKPGELVAGHKKDVVIAQRLHTDSNKIAFHGFYDAQGYPHEPCHESKKPLGQCVVDVPVLAHSRRFSDYSQGVRLVHPTMVVDGQNRAVTDVLADKELAMLISSEGVVNPPRIPKTRKG
jgi:hypothetical protein